MKAALFDALQAARIAKRSVALVTRLGDGSQCLLEQGTLRGELALDEAQLEEVKKRLAAVQSGTLAGDENLFVRIYAPAPRMLIVGAVHIAQVLAPMAAMAGFEVTIIDPRRAFASEERFPGVALTDEWPGEAMARLAPDAQTAVVTLSHDPKLDDPALVAALASPAFYIGALGSSRTQAKRIARLKEQGMESELHRIHAPVGLDLGGRSPAEIAVSALAQVIQVRYRRASTP